MEYYTLQGDEVVLFKGRAGLNGGENAVDVVLTNLFIVFIKKFEGEDTAEIETHAVDSIKIYRDTHWIKQNVKTVEIYFRDGESVLASKRLKSVRFLLTHPSSEARRKTGISISKTASEPTPIIPKRRKKRRK